MDSPDGDLALAEVHAHATAATIPPVDAVIVAVKTTDTDGVLDTVRELAADGAVVIAMQNGLGVEEALADAVPGATVLGAMCFMCSNKVGPGHVRHLDFGRVTVGEHGVDGETDAVTAFVADLAAAGIAASGLDDLRLGRWKKLVWNIPYNGLSVVLDAGTDELMADPHTRALVEALMREVVAGAAGLWARGAGLLRRPDARRHRAHDPVRDVDEARLRRGPAARARAIYGVPLERARAAGYEMVRVQALYEQLRFLDTRRSGSHA